MAVNSCVIVTGQDSSRYGLYRATIKISSKIDESAWVALKSLAQDSHQSIFGVLTEAVEGYVRRRRVRPDILQHLEDSITQNEELGRRLAE